MSQKPVVYFRTREGGTLTCDHDPSATFRDLRGEVSEQIGAPVEQLIIMLSGRQPSLDETLAAADVQPGRTMELIVRLTAE